jgi:ubiquinone/menaquinone biosynthesis C-methylase UbiE
MVAARLDKEAVREVYTGLAPWYDTWANLTEVRPRKRAIELAAVRDGERVLEVAVGTGLAMEELARANPSGQTTGLDLTPGMLAQARRRMASLPEGSWSLLEGDATALPFADASFDLVLNNYMFDLLAEAEFAPVLAEMHRVLRPGGRLVLVNMTTGDRWWLRAYESIYRWSPRLMGGCRGVTMSGYVEAACFTSVQREVLSQGGFPSEVIHARREHP